MLRACNEEKGKEEGRLKKNKKTEKQEREGEREGGERVWTERILHKSEEMLHVAFISLLMHWTSWVALSQISTYFK